MPIRKVSFEETLLRSVVEPRLCVGCASCVISCPFNCLEYSSGGPELISECKMCGICAQVCPRFNTSLSSLERFVFGRERNTTEEFGVYRRILVAQTSSDDVRMVCQDGGLVTSLLIFAIEKGIVNGAAISGKSSDEPLKAVPKLALSRNDILECAGTRYTYSPNLLALKEGVQNNVGKLSFVGTPCQIHAVRKLQMLPLKKYADAISFTVGLFCSESFTYNGLIKSFFQERMGIKLGEVSGINIKGKMILRMKDGEVKAIPLRDVKEYSCTFCRACPDFSAELADISAGGLGLEGWTLTVVRTEVGDEIVSEAESKGVIKTKPLEDKRLIDLLIKMSRRKREVQGGFIH
ncbi:MAG: Coenzyme F420 hydrogenase/dehydrogenase, beta subunit C-terminal domain [Candidatus Bathyarchaeia archaeon]|nr:Coenzyme F420 hydrogenase/dehydrogenase, beta subunit C-terminal domain [Candidatus Bathyarchaeota archaeon]